MKNALLVAICFLLLLSVSCSNDIREADEHLNMEFLGYFESEPENPAELDFYYNTSDGMSYVYIDGSWHIAAWKPSEISSSFENIEFTIDGEEFYADGQNMFSYDLLPIRYEDEVSQYVFNINLKNTGSYPVDISSFQLKNHSSELKLDRTDFPKVLKPGDSAALKCSYSPSLSGKRNSLLYFQVDLQDEYTEYWVNSCYLAPYFTFNTDISSGQINTETIGAYTGNYYRLDYGNVKAGDKRSIEFHVQATEYGDAHIEDISLAGEDSSDFRIEFPEKDNIMKHNLILNGGIKGRKKVNLVVKTDLRGNEEVSIPIEMNAIE